MKVRIPNQGGGQAAMMKKYVVLLIRHFMMF